MKTYKIKAWLDNLGEMVNTDVLSHKGGNIRKKDMFFNQMKNFYVYIDILKLFYMINILMWYFVLFCFSFFLWFTVTIKTNQTRKKKKYL